MVVHSPAQGHGECPAIVRQCEVGTGGIYGDAALGDKFHEQSFPLKVKIITANELADKCQINGFVTVD
jgi:hypothetical protein